MAEEINQDEQIGFHKGSLATLAKEREELLKMANVVEQLMHLHIDALQKLGVNLQQSAEKQSASDDDRDKPIEDLL